MGLGDGFGLGLGRGRGLGYGRGFGKGKGGFSGYSCVKFVFFGFNVFFWVRFFIYLKKKKISVLLILKLYFNDYI